MQAERDALAAEKVALAEAKAALATEVGEMHEVAFKSWWLTWWLTMMGEGGGGLPIPDRAPL